MRPASGSFDGLSTSCVSPSVVVTLVQHARRGRDEVEVELALEPLLHDLHVQQPEEAAAEAEAERCRRLRLERERRVVQLQLLERVAQFGILVPFDRIEPGEDHRLHFLEAGERLGGRSRRLGDRVADLRVAEALDVGDDEADLADAELSTGSGLGEKIPTWSMSYDWPLIIIVTFMPARMVPSMTRTRTMTPR